MSGDWVPGNPNDRSREGFRIRHGSARGPMSASFYHKLKKLKIAPRETCVAGKIIITHEAERDWEKARDNPKGTEARLVAKTKRWRHERALKAGAAAVDSPRHVSKQGPRRKAR